VDKRGFNVQYETDGLRGSDLLVASSAIRGQEAAPTSGKFNVDDSVFFWNFLIRGFYFRKPRQATRKT